jgi:hypothetical protein
MNSMKRIGFILCLFIVSTAFTQNTTVVNYKVNTATIPNPERGFYKHTETTATKYIPLEENELVSYRLKNNNTLVLRIFYLEKFLNTPIDKTYLNAIKADFVTIRKAGLKCIVRFAYSRTTEGQRDANKKQMLQHIAQLKPIFEANADVITLVQAGFIGTWGEWFYTTNFGMKPTAVDYANRKDIMEALLTAVPKTRMVQFRTPFLKQKIYQLNPVSKEEAYKETAVARTGHFNDCFLSDETDNGTFSNVSSESPYLEAETRYVPMGGETCDPNTIRSNCTTALTEMNRFHYSFLNMDYNAGVLTKFKNDKCFGEIGNRLGYRFELQSAEFPNQLAPSEKLHCSLTIVNTGFATPFNKKTVRLILRNKEDRKEYPIALATDPRFWEKDREHQLAYDLDIPTTVPSGTYDLLLHITDEDSRLSSRPEYAIQLANVGTWESRTGYNKLLHSVVISSPNITNPGTTTINSTPNIVPSPADESLTIKATDIASFEIIFYNSIGEKVLVDKISQTSTKTVFATKNLPEGTYLIELIKDGNSEFLKAVIEH